MAGYREEAGVDPLSRTETYAAMRLDVDNWRWAGRAVLRAYRQAAAAPGSPRWRCSSSGRRTCRSRPTSSPSCDADALILRIQPNEGISLRFGAKVPGPLVPGAHGEHGLLVRARRSARSRRRRTSGCCSTRCSATRRCSSAPTRSSSAGGSSTRSSSTGRTARSRSRPTRPPPGARPTPTGCSPRRPGLAQVDRPMDRLSGQAISDAVGAHGWRLVLGGLRTSVEVGSLARAAEVAGILAAVAGDGLRLDLRPDRVHVTIHPPGPVTARETDLAVRMSAALRAAGFTPSPTGVQAFEIAIDALDIAAMRPFWKAVFGYVSTRRPSPRGDVRPALGRGPRSGSSGWTRRGRSATGSTSTSGFRTTRGRGADRGVLAPPAGGWSTTGGARVHGGRRPGGQRGLRVRLGGTRLTVGRQRLCAFLRTAGRRERWHTTTPVLRDHAKEHDFHASVPARAARPARSAGDRHPARAGPAPPPRQPRPPTSRSRRASSLDWSDCGGGFQCATATVPRDYGTRRADVPAARHQVAGEGPVQADRDDVRQPGRAGRLRVGFLRAAPPGALDGFARFDVVSWDPRGIGGSVPAVDCSTPEEDNAYANTTFTPLFEVDLPGRSATPAGPCGRASRATPAPAVPRHREHGPRPRPAPAGRRRREADVHRHLLRRAPSARRTRACSPAGRGRCCWTRRSTRTSGRTGPWSCGREQNAAFEDSLDRFFCLRRVHLGGTAPRLRRPGRGDEPGADARSGRHPPDPVRGDDVLRVATIAMYSRYDWPPLSTALRRRHRRRQPAAGPADSFAGRRPDGTYQSTGGVLRGHRAGLPAAPRRARLRRRRAAPVRDVPAPVAVRVRPEPRVRRLRPAAEGRVPRPVPQPGRCGAGPGHRRHARPGDAVRSGAAVWSRSSATRGC